MAMGTYMHIDRYIYTHTYLLKMPPITPIILHVHDKGEYTFKPKHTTVNRVVNLADDEIQPMQT